MWHVFGIIDEQGSIRKERMVKSELGIVRKEYK
jgi:hypothetical protein